MQKKILIFSFTRTGSTNLAIILNLHPKIKMMHEPFHKRKENELQKKFNITNKIKLDNALKEIFSKYNAFKHIESQFSLNMNKNLLTKNYKIIFLLRKNHLRRVVSEQISRNTKIWHTFEQIEPYKEIDAISLKNISKELKREFKLIDLYQNILKETKADYLQIYYEDIFGESKSKTQKLELINNIISFLELDLIDKDYFERINAIIDPANSRLNFEDSYLKIKNIKEIEREFGNKKNGHLLSFGKLIDGLEK